MLTIKFIPFFLFFFGLYGFLFITNNMILLLICLELMLLSLNILIVLASIFWYDIFGELFVLNILGVTAAEVAIGLAIIVIFYRFQGSIKLITINNIKS
jgi:NADH-quinone oxidoreductase subunit K